MITKPACKCLISSSRRRPKIKGDDKYRRLSQLARRRCLSAGDATVLHVKLATDEMHIFLRINVSTRHETVFLTEKYEKRKDGSKQRVRSLGFGQRVKPVRFILSRNYNKQQHCLFLFQGKRHHFRKKKTSFLSHIINHFSRSITPLSFQVFLFGMSVASALGLLTNQNLAVESLLLLLVSFFHLCTLQSPIPDGRQASEAGLQP